jgi:hypothetical protein
MKYRIEIIKSDGESEFYKKQEEVPLFLLLRALEKCEIKSFTISLD